MKFMSLEKKDSVYVLTLRDGENDNTLTPEVLAEYLQCFDMIEQDKSDASLLICSAHPKTFCNGINLPWLQTQTVERFLLFVKEMDIFLGRLALLNLPVIAAINGNCYAGGALIASACDFRFMRADRGRFCFSEVNIKIPFSPLMMEILRHIPNPKALRDLTLTGKAIGGVEAQALSVVDEIYSEEELPIKAFEFAAMMAQKDRSTYSAIKKLLRNNIPH